MPNKQKLKEIYNKMSTPEEKLEDLLELIDPEKLKGDDGHTPTEEELKAIIKPLIPKPVKGDDGHTPTEEELLEMIKPLIPPAIPGKDGNLITPEEVRDKLKELKGKDKLSVLDLKDLEWLKSKEGMNWASAGFKVYTDSSLTGDGSFGNPLKVIPSATSTKVAVDASDTNPDYLNPKITVSGGLTKTIVNSGGNEHINIDASGITPEDSDKVRISATDTTPDFLSPKLVAGTNVTLTKQNSGGNENIKIDVPTMTTSPASPSGSIQYNNSGVFGGSSNATLDGSGNVLFKGTASFANAKATIDSGGTGHFQGIFMPTGHVGGIEGQFTAISPDSNYAMSLGFIKENQGSIFGNDPFMFFYSQYLGGYGTGGGDVYEIDGLTGQMNLHGFFTNDGQRSNLDRWGITEDGTNAAFEISGIQQIANPNDPGIYSSNPNFNGSAYTNDTVNIYVYGYKFASDGTPVVSTYSPAQTTITDNSDTPFSVDVQWYDVENNGQSIDGYILCVQDTNTGNVGWIDVGNVTSYTENGQISSLNNGYPNLTVAPYTVYGNALSIQSGKVLFGSSSPFIPSGGNPVTLSVGYGAYIDYLYSNAVRSTNFIVNGGTSSQFLKADGSVDGATYLPFKSKGTATLVAGTKAITISGLTSGKQAFVQLTTTGGTLGNSYKAVCTNNTLTITSVTVAGATQTLDTSTLNYLII